MSTAIKINNAISSKIAKTHRLEARLSAEQKNLFQYAANLLGRTLTDYVISTLQESSLLIIQQHEMLNLTHKDRQLFIESLLNPPRPNTKLTNAIQRYQREVVAK